MSRDCTKKRIYKPELGKQVGCIGVEYSCVRQKYKKTHEEIHEGCLAGFCKEDKRARSKKNHTQEKGDKECKEEIGFRKAFYPNLELKVLPVSIYHVC